MYKKKKKKLSRVCTHVTSVNPSWVIAQLQSQRLSRHKLSNNEISSSRIALHLRSLDKVHKSILVTDSLINIHLLIRQEILQRQYNLDRKCIKEKAR